MDAVVKSLKNPERQAKLLAALKAVADSGRYTEGAFTYNLEKKMSHLTHNQHAISFNSDASAWYTLFRYYHIQGKSTVAMANNSFYAVGAMALQAGLKVFLIDSKPYHPSMAEDSLREIIKDVQIVVINHVGGWLAEDYFNIGELCSQHGKVLIEDCTDVMGLQTVEGRLGEACVWSFYPSKAIPVGECGVLTTRDFVLRDFAKLFRQCGKHIQGGTLHYGRGMSLKISEWDAAVAYIQLNSIQEILAARKRDYEVLQSIAPPLIGGHSNYYKYPVASEIVLGWKTSNQIYSHTEQLNACFHNTKIETTNLVNSYRWAENHRCLPLGEDIYHGMTKEQVEDTLMPKSKVK